MLQKLVDPLPCSHYCCLHAALRSISRIIFPEVLCRGELPIRVKKRLNILQKSLQLIPGKHDAIISPPLPSNGALPSLLADFQVML